MDTRGNKAPGTNWKQIAAVAVVSVIIVGWFLNRGIPSTEARDMTQQISRLRELLNATKRVAPSETARRDAIMDQIHAIQDGAESRGFKVIGWRITGEPSPSR